MTEKLYTVEYMPDREEDYSEFDESEDDYAEQPPADWERWDEWNEFCMERWGERKPFFMPKANQIYRSRSSAIARANLINYWGGNAQVFECTPVWEGLEAAKKRRERERLMKRREKHVREAGALSARIWELS